MARLAPFFKQQFFDNDGAPLAGGKVYSYTAGTSTPLATYTDQGGATPNANPVILDANGEANIWVSDAYYKFVIKDANDVTLRTIDQASVANDVVAEATAARDAALAAQAAAETAETNAETAETNAETAETNAAASASAAATSATNAATSATNAATSTTNAANSATAAATSETNAATSATNAATSATNAANSATAAATSETNAANSATAAAASVSAATGLAEYADDAAFVTANGTAEDGDIYYNTTSDKVRVYANGAWAELGGGGGGGSLQWVEDTDSPIPEIENNNQVYQFGAGLSQNLYALIRAPNSYTAGSPINLRMVFYSPDTTGTVLMRAQATLIRTGTDAISSTTNQRTTTNSAVNLATAALADKPYAVDLDISDSSGQINAVAVSAGDLIKVRLYRDTDTASSDVRVPVYGAEVTAS